MEVTGQQAIRDDGANPRLLISGLDSLYVSFYFDVRNSTVDFEELAYQKERVKEARRESFSEIQLGTEKFALMPFGKHPYTYVLSNEAFEVRLGEKMIPSCHVQFSSEILWQCGLDDALKRFRSWCASMRLAARVPEVVARADWAFDFALRSVDFTADHFVSRLRKDSIHRSSGAVQTFTLGRGATVLRVYDKVAEVIEQSQKFWLFDLWAQHEEVWRVEFQVRRERLQEGGINTLDDLRELQGDLLRELATEHTTLRRPSADTNRTRWPLHPLWLALKEAIASLPQTGLIREIDPKRNLNMRLWYQGRSIYGCLKGFAALIAEREGLPEPPKYNEFMGYLATELKPHSSTLIWRADVAKRMKALRLGQW